MSTAVTITIIICVTLVALSAINAISTNKRAKDSRTIFDDLFKGGK